MKEWDFYQTEKRWKNGVPDRENSWKLTKVKIIQIWVNMPVQLRMKSDGW